MYGFIFINASNLTALFSLSGLIQIALVLLSWPLALLIKRLCHTKFRLIHKPLHHLLKKCLADAFTLLLFAIFAIFSGLIYSWFSGLASILNYSVAVFAIAMIVVNFVYYSVAFAFGNTKNHFILAVVKYILWLLLILWATNLDTLVANSLSAISLTFGKTRVSIWFLFKQLSIVLIDVAIMLWISNIFDNWVKNAKDLDANIKQLLTRISKVLIIGVGIYIILPSLGIDLTALSIFGGAVGVGLGFGLQKIASNFLSGFIILVDKSVKIGDRVIINDVTGTITKITTRYTVMQAFDGSEIIIPNERFITDTIINQTHTNNEISLDLMISVSYTANLTLAIEIIRNCIQQIDNIRQDKEPSVYIKTLNASGIDIFIRVWPKDPINETNLIRNKLNIALVEALQSHQIEIPFPKLDVNIVRAHD